MTFTPFHLDRPIEIRSIYTVHYFEYTSSYAFAGEYSVEQYSGCNVFVFKDMHLLKKCSPKSVNLAMYDATSSDVLLGCLDALYSKIGGPLAETFGSEGDEGSLGECQVRRIAKSGVEATVGTNYSVLLDLEIKWICRSFPI